MVMPAFLLSPLIRWAAVAVIIGVLFGWAIWERHDAQAAAKGEKAALAQLASATERANANYAATQQCFAQVEQDKTSITLQNDAAEKLRASINDMERAAVHLETEKAQLLQTLEDRTAATEAEAKAHPDQVVPVGSIVRARAGGLWE